MAYYLYEDVTCIGCNTKAAQLTEYIDAAIEWDYKSAAEYVISEEGTFNVKNGHFLCTPCYVQWGAPTGEHGWVAP